MSQHFDFRGRQVVDPALAYRDRPPPNAAGGHASGAGSGMTGIESAWSTMSQAKSALRRVEHRLTESDQADILQGDGGYSVSVDRVPSYRLAAAQQTGYPPASVVDDHGKTSYMKSRAEIMDPTRKASKTEDKYREEAVHSHHSSKSRSPLREANAGGTVSEPSHRAAPLDSYARYRSQSGVAGSDTGRSFKPETDSGSSTHDVGGGSRSARETEINFLNDFTTRAPRSQRADYLPTKFAQVDVTVPKSDPYQNGGGGGGGGSSAYRGGAAPPGESRMASSSSYERDKTDTTYTVSGSSNGMSRSGKVKRSIMTMDKHEDGLARVREMIRKQRKLRTSRDSKEEGVQPTLPEPAKRVRHTDEELVSPANYELHAPADEPVLPVRKVATGPPPPKYQGFSEVETRYKVPEPRVPEVRSRKVARMLGEDRASAWREDKGTAKKEVRLQLKESAIKDGGGSHGGDKSEERKKMTRVVAPAHKPSKYERKDIITTSSWRSGQKAVLRELGPRKMPHSQSPPTRDAGMRDDSEEKHYDIEGHKESFQGHPDAPHKDTAKGQTKDKCEGQQKVTSEGHPSDKAVSSLSAEARKVLDDLDSDDSVSGDEEDAAKHDHKVTEGGGRSSRSRRKHGRPADRDKESAGLSRVKHYKTDEVRRYIAKQKSDRKKRMKEQEEERRKAEEAKQQQLKELYQRQRESARSTSRNRGQRSAAPDDMHLELRDDRKMSGGESDKENRRHSDDTESDVSSSDASTLTETKRSEPEGQSNPKDVGKTTTRGRSKQHSSHGKDSTSVNSKENAVEDLIQKYVSGQPRGGGATSQQDATARKSRKAADIVSGLARDTGMSVDDIMAKYAKQAQAIKAQRHDDAVDGPPPSSSAQRRDAMPAYSSVPAAAPSIAMATPDGATTVTPAAPSSQMSRVERIQALRNTATSLQTRIQVEARRITSSEKEAWSAPRAAADSLDYVGRYQRMTGAKDSYSVFESELPGVGNLAESAGMQHKHTEQNCAATKIQAAFRGHTVRQAVGWRVPRHKSVGLYRSKPSRPAATDLSHTESDATLTDDSLVNDRWTHKSAFSQPMYGESAAAALQPSCPRPAWEEPKPDPYSILNILTRKQRMAAIRGKSRLPQYPDDSDDEEMKEARVLAREADRQKAAKSRGSARTLRDSVDDSGADTSASDNTRSDVDYKDDFTTVASETHPTTSHSSRQHSSASREVSKRTIHLKSKSRSSRHGDKRKGDGKDEEDTLDRTLTPSLASDEEAGDADEGRKGTSLSLVPTSHHSRRVGASDGLVTGTGAPESDWSDVSSLTEEGESYRREKPVAFTSKYQTTGYQASQLSPGTLEHRMALELNRLETMEESLRQLSDVDRTRGVSMAQQETVSLAQILKARQQTHSKELSELKVKARQESEAASRQLEDARQRAADSAQHAAATLAQVRQDSTAPLQQSTQKLIDSQMQVAAATAEAARKLAEANAAAPRQTAAAAAAAAGGGGRVDAVLMKEAAATAASAAVTAALQQYRPMHMGGGHVRHEASTQWSQHSLYTGDLDDLSLSQLESSYDSSTSSYRPPSSSHPSFAKRSDAHGEKSAHTASTTVRDVGAAGSDVTSEVHTATDLSRGGADRTGSTVGSGSVSTAIDASRDRNQSAVSSIQTESGLREDEPSRTDSVLEELPSEKDYTLEFDTSVTEDEVEKSLREVLPSEGQRKKLKRETSSTDIGAPPTDDLRLPEPTASRRLSFEEDSFQRFTVDIVKQYMKEEELRAQHQSTLLKLRERALKEKTKTELAWLEQQKHRVRSKGADDSYPQLKKRQRGLLRRLQQEQAELKRLQEVQKAASKERQLMLLQSEQLVKMQHSTKQMLHKIQVRTSTRVDAWLNAVDLEGYFLSSESSLSSVDQLKRGVSPPPLDESSMADVPTEEELSIQLDETSTSRTPSPHKDKSEYEGALESNGDQGRSRSPSDAKMLQKLKKMRLDSKFLTVREQKLRQRRRKAEELMAWKRRLDEEEMEIEQIEKAALKANRAKEAQMGKAPEVPQLTPRTTRTPRTPRADAAADSILAERPDTARSAKSGITSIAEELTSAVDSAPRDKTQTGAGSDSSTQDDSRSAEHSITEEIPTETKTTPPIRYVLSLLAPGGSTVLAMS